MKEKLKNIKLPKRRSKPAGLPPGTLIHVGERRVENVRMTYIDYNEQNFDEKQVAAIEDCFVFKTTPTVTWINIDGLHDVQIIEKIGQRFEMHPLVLEDILHTGQRPKFEDYERYIFIVITMLSFNGENQAIETEQVSIVLG
jgi:magnesium transporter